ncbi:MAG: hypothetical protein ACRD0N_03240 [Acidimicrobiales bacterium]
MVRAVLAGMAKAGRLSLAGAADAVEGPARALARKSTAGAAELAGRYPDERSLAKALNAKPASPLLGGATAAALVTKVAKRVGPLRFVARRTPLWLAATLVPALHASVTRGAEELRQVAAYLHHRARQAEVTPDADRVRRAAVQIVTGQPVDPGREPTHATMVTAWLQRAVRATLPFAEGVRTRDPEGLAAAAGRIDPRSLGP